MLSVDEFYETFIGLRMEQELVRESESECFCSVKMQVCGRICLGLGHSKMNERSVALLLS